MTTSSKIPKHECCPFCGSYHLSYNSNRDPGQCWLECNDCEAKGPTVNMSIERWPNLAKAAASKKWNGWLNILNRGA